VLPHGSYRLETKHANVLKLNMLAVQNKLFIKKNTLKKDLKSVDCGKSPCKLHLKCYSCFYHSHQSLKSSTHSWRSPWILRRKVDLACSFIIKVRCVWNADFFFLKTMFEVQSMQSSSSYVSRIFRPLFELISNTKRDQQK
jgi:hypothetical protein